MVWMSITELCVTLLEDAKFSTVTLPAGHVLFQGDEKTLPLADLNPEGKPRSAGFAQDGYHVTNTNMIPLAHLEFSEVAVTVKTVRVLPSSVLKHLLKKDKK